MNMARGDAFMVLHVRHMQPWIHFVSNAIGCNTVAVADTMSHPTGWSLRILAVSIECSDDLSSDPWV